MSNRDPECQLRRGDGKLATVAPQSLALRFLKWECPDGIYTLTGPGVALMLQRNAGVVIPLSGKIEEANLKALSGQQPNPEEN